MAFGAGQLAVNLDARWMGVKGSRVLAVGDEIEAGRVCEPEDAVATRG